MPFHLLGVGFVSMIEPRTSGPRGYRFRLARRLADLHPAAMIHGALVMGATLALMANTTPADLSMLSAAGVLVIYWFTHAYTYALGQGIDGDHHRLAVRLVAGSRHEVPILLGGLPALLVCTAALVLGAELATAMMIGLWLTVVLMAAYGYLAAHLAGVLGWRVAAETTFAALLGLCMVALNTLLH